MRNQNCLTKDQNNFLIACREHPAVLEKLLEPVGLTLKRLFRWLRRKYFRQTLAEVSGEMRRMTKLELAVLVRLANQTLTKALTGDLSVTEMQRDTAALIVQNYFMAFPNRRRSKRKGEQDLVPRSSRLIHPDVSDERARELIARMAATEQSAPAKNP